MRLRCGGRLAWGMLVRLARVALSMAIGNIVAISQTSFKRMLAYSTISHMGFIAGYFGPVKLVMHPACFISSPTH
jgi:NADH:ubiquinone oxidoreductase subunit 2 (subunit N)